MAKKAAKKAERAPRTVAGPATEREGPSPPPRVTRHVRPMGPRILVRVIRSSDQLDSGLYLPKGAKDDAAEALLGEVLEVARTMPATVTYYDNEADEREAEHFEGENVSGIPVNSRILFTRNSGVAVPWDESLRLLHVRHVLAIVDEISEEHLQ